MNIKKKIFASIKNKLGQSVPDKIMVFESDDWGSLRMPSKYAFNKLKGLGIKLNVSADRVEQIENPSDLSNLYDVLSKFKDAHGSPPVLTSFFNLVNPDFELIKKSDYVEYSYEPFWETIDKYSNWNKVFKLYREGIDSNLFEPQYHGREHLNVIEWMRYLKQGNTILRKACDLHYYSVMLPSNVYEDSQFHIVNGFRRAFYYRDKESLEILKCNLVDGYKLFKDIFGYSPSVFDPANGIFSPELDSCLLDCGISTIVTNRFRREPDINGKLKKKYYRFGNLNSNGQLVYIRNCVLEPFSDDGRDELNCMSYIDSAFNNNKPAIVSTHRLNYLGGLDKTNRDKGLKSLKNLLKKVLEKHPDVTFMSSSQLSKYLLNQVEANE